MENKEILSTNNIVRGDYLKDLAKRNSVTNRIGYSETDSQGKAFDYSTGQFIEKNKTRKK